MTKYEPRWAAEQDKMVRRQMDRQEAALAFSAGCGGVGALVVLLAVAVGSIFGLLFLTGSC